MDKDNLGIQKIFAHPAIKNLTTEKRETIKGDIQQQILTAFFLMLVGIFLAFTGFIGLFFRLLRFAGFNMVSAAQSLTHIPVLYRKRIEKLSVSK
ncbi:MAG TPA: hypothetical protein VL995_10965 [Cellvibrio sp.]|nr:hypothetical protein [Cellvibrio sp.]